MDFLLIIVVIIFIALIMPKPQEVGKKDNELVIKKKQCPPHQWVYKEIIDQHGVKHGEKLTCTVCGPMQSQSGREE